ncbi:MAG: hypothetical protein OXN84_07135 [Albidovulum sp.]|nr:hypothetical protein [Albidovulum sp.]
MFGDEARAKAWIAERLWPNSPHFADCGTFRALSEIKRNAITHRCRYRPKLLMSSLRMATNTEGSTIAYRVRAIGFCMLSANARK